MFQAIPLTQIQHSAANIRKVDPSKAADRELLASIEALGLQQNLVVQAVEGRPDDAPMYEVIAGGRRLAALQHLEKEGKVDTDQEIACRVLEPGENAEEVSLAENTQRAELHPADKFEAIAGLVARGMNQADIAGHFGISKGEVRKLLKLGSVAPQVLAAFREGKLTMEAVQAFTLSADFAAQVRVLRAGKRWPLEIRKELMGEAMRVDDRLVVFVGLDVYKKAGGAVVADLFSDGKWVADPDLVRNLAELRLKQEFDKVREEGWAVVSATLDPGQSKVYKRLPAKYQTPDGWADTVAAAERAVEMADEAVWNSDLPVGSAEKTALLAAYDAAVAEVDRLEQECDTLYRIYPDKALASAELSIDWDGSLVIDRGVYNEAQRAALAAAGWLDVDDAEAGSAAVAGDAPPLGISKALWPDMRKARAEAVRRFLYRSPAVASRLLEFSVARAAFDAGRWEPTVPLGLIATFSADSGEVPEGGCPSLRAADLADLPLDWLKGADLHEQFLAFLALSAADARRVISFAVGEILPVSGADEIFPDLLVLAAMEGKPIDIPEVFAPGVENYFSRLTRARLLQIGADYWGVPWVDKFGRKGKAHLLAAFEESVNNRGDFPLGDWYPPEFLQGVSGEGAADE